MEQEKRMGLLAFIIMYIYTHEYNSSIMKSLLIGFLSLFAARTVLSED